LRQLSLRRKIGVLMKKTIENKIASISLMLVIMISFFINVIAQNNTVKSNNSKAKISDSKVALNAKISGTGSQFEDAVELTLTIKNETNSIIVLFDDDVMRGFNISIKDPNLLNVPLTVEGRRKKYPVKIIRRAGVFIEPNKEVVLSSINLDNFFDLKYKGKYTLTIECSYSLEDVSNKSSIFKKSGVLTREITFEIK
jgi:hypothetical protein